MAIPEELMAILVCPECKGPLEDRGDTLWCAQCRLEYPVREGIPIMLPEEARRPDEESR